MQFDVGIDEQQPGMARMGSPMVSCGGRAAVGFTYDYPGAMGT